MIRELPTGKGFADVVFVPKARYANKPAIIVELKWNVDADTAIEQIKRNEYPKALKDWGSREIILVGIAYDKKSREHRCRIEKM